jgi:hypothetical protein
MMKPGQRNLLIANSSLVSKRSLVVKNNGIMSHRRRTQFDLIARPVRPAYKTTLPTIYEDKEIELHDDHLLQTVNEKGDQPSLQLATDWGEVELTYEENMPQVKKTNGFRRRLNNWLAGNLPPSARRDFKSNKK